MTSAIVLHWAPLLHPQGPLHRRLGYQLRIHPPEGGCASPGLRLAALPEGRMVGPQAGRRGVCRIAAVGSAAMPCLSSVWLAVVLGSQVRAGQRGIPLHSLRSGAGICFMLLRGSGRPTHPSAGKCYMGTLGGQLLACPGQLAAGRWQPAAWGGVAQELLSHTHIANNDSMASLLLDIPLSGSFQATSPPYVPRSS